MVPAIHLGDIGAVPGTRTCLASPATVPRFTRPGYSDESSLLAVVYAGTHLRRTQLIGPRRLLGRPDLPRVSFPAAGRQVTAISHVKSYYTSLSALNSAITSSALAPSKMLSTTLSIDSSILIRMRAVSTYVASVMRRASRATRSVSCK